MMKANFQSRNEFYQYLRENGRFLGSGKEGDAYLINHQVWKIYRYSYIPSYSQNLDDLTKFAELHIDGFSFIRDVILIGEEKEFASTISDYAFVATISDYASGRNLIDTKLALCQISKIIHGLKKLETAVALLSEKRIAINDLCLANIIYKDGTFQCIDTNSYCFDTDPSTLYSHNMKQITDIIMSALFGFGYLRGYFNEISKYNRYKDNRELNASPIDLLGLIKTELEELCGFELKQFAFANKPLARLLKK